MADFDTPFAADAGKRYPSLAEHENGFPCGPADQALFNGLFHRIEAEIGAVINYAGLVQTDEDLTQLLQALQAMIAEAVGAIDTGGPDVSGFILMSQARTRLPIFPDVATTDGKILVTSPGTGAVRLPAGTSFQHRGIYPVVTALTDFVTDASKTYHLRWNPTTGYELKDLADTGYNPSVLAETSLAFDSKYDDMLIARVVTNSSNVPTITNLANKDRLFMEILNAGVMSSPATNDAYRNTSLTWNLARRPQCSIEVTEMHTSPVAGADNTFPASATHDHDYWVTRSAHTRYGVNLVLRRDWALSMDILANVSM